MLVLPSSSSISDRSPKHLINYFHLITSSPKSAIVTPSKTSKFQDFKMLFPSTFATTAAVLLAVITDTAALPSNNVARQDDGVQRCKVQAKALHQYGGGSPYQQAVDNVSNGAVTCYDKDDNAVFSKPRTAEAFQGDVTTVTAAECRTLGDVTLKTSFNSASNSFVTCTATYNGVDTEGVKATHIETNIVSTSTAFCYIWIPC
ncbi:hypothetical protein IQ06DRAFT_348232 [Phaeosphaeriaceae sp. SRC1lsM3a]|nr:hypothetical protein IQ06DRAFT_348232 [Stagonospora sp. SRC1lsM3a]